MDCEWIAGRVKIFLKIFNFMLASAGRVWYNVIVINEVYQAMPEVYQATCVVW